MSEAILQLRGIYKSFSRHQNGSAFNVIDDLNLTLPEGRITALIGGNGSGKTTLFNIVSRLLDADDGEMVFYRNAAPILLNQQAPHQISRLGIGRMFQDNHTLNDISILDNMCIAAAETFGETPFVSLFHPGRQRRTEAARIARACQVFREFFDVDNIFWQQRHQPARVLSYGQRRLLGLARLMMGDYRLVLLDEPTAGIHPELIQQIRRIIRRLAAEKGMTVFLIEHNMKFVAETADICCFMQEGKIAVSGTPETVLQNPEVRSSYLGGVC